MPWQYVGASTMAFPLLLLVAFLFLFVIPFYVALKLFYSSNKLTKEKKEERKQLPPGPLALPFVGNLLWFTNSLFDLEPILNGLMARHGPIVALRMGPLHSIFVASRELAHEALVQRAAVLANRRPPLGTDNVISSNGHSIASSPYGPLWRLLRKNLVTEVLHPARLAAHAAGRRQAAHAMAEDLVDGRRTPRETFYRALFNLLLHMCFGEKHDEGAVPEVEARVRALLQATTRETVFNFLPRLARIVLWRRWREFLEIRRRADEILVPLIKARRMKRQADQDAKKKENHAFLPYVDSLLGLKDPLEGREFTDGEIVTMCVEFLIGGTDTTAPALEWIFARLVKHQDIQAKVREEIERVVKGEEEIREEHLKEMLYLKAVVMEGLRRHPPVHFVLPHAASEQIMLGGYVIPEGAMVNFMLAEISRDSTVWEEPMEFKPERFLEGNAMDITGTREIKMMPFGAGRRICPGINLALLHLEYFTAFLVREFEWRPQEGEEIDLAEKQTATVVMKYPLRAHLFHRRN